MKLCIEGRDLRQTFNRRTIFKGVGFAVQERETLLITGRNGAGKSTLVRIVCGVLTPSAGNVTITADGSAAGAPDRDGIGLVSPYLQVYEEFSAMENLHLSMTLRGLRADAERGRRLLERMALDPRRGDPVRGFSSGMKQRLKYAMALIHEPPVLILDEPMSNLDADGIAIVRGVMEEHVQDGVLIVATNDRTDAGRADREVDLNAQR